MTRNITGFLASMLLFGTAASLSGQVQVPTSHGEERNVDTPILRVPLLSKPPEINGIMSPGEWDDASALSAFWYDAHYGDFKFMAPEQTQLQLYAGYDRENLYFCFNSPIYPEDSWLKARGRFPDVLWHPLYGMILDDHTELELRPCGDLKRGYELGLLRWDVNPIGTFNDWYWSREGGMDFRWKSGAKIGTVADGKRWVVEYAIPLKSLRYGHYDAKDEDGRPLVAIPPPDGTAYRTWFSRGIGGNGPFYNAFDAHPWNTTKTMLIFDSKSPVFQINELGAIMDGKIDVQMTVKNHDTRSETVRLGFHIENGDGESVYSSYRSREIPDGLIELRPGETRKLRLTYRNPKLSIDGNALWFDVRSAGEPAKVLFLTRLVDFHLMDGGMAGTPPLSFRERRIDVIETLRPKRVPYFDLTVDVSPYTKRLSALVDRGIDGVKEEVKTAVEARLIVKHVSGEEPEDIHEFVAPVIGNFASFLCDATNLVPGEAYEVRVLLFDENMKIVGEQTERKPFIKLNHGLNPSTTATRSDRFTIMPFIKTTASDDRVFESFMANRSEGNYVRTRDFQVSPWMNNTLGLEDRVWEPFTPIAPNKDGFETLKHRFTIDASGLPAQIDIRPDPRELPLEQRAANAKVSPATLLAIGRGPQLRAPLRIEAVVGGKRVPARALAPAKAVRTGKSEIEYASLLRIGPLDAELRTRYECDGSLHATLTYGSDAPVNIDRLELVADVAGTVDLMLSQTTDMAYTGADRGECGLSKKPGVLWDSTMTKMELFYTRFVPWFWFGSADRGWSWYADGDEGCILDKDGSAMQLERDKAGDVTWRAVFVNHLAEVKGPHKVTFSILTHPAKPKPDRFRREAWHYVVGSAWAEAETRATGDTVKTPEVLQCYVDEKRLIEWWRIPGRAPKDAPDDQRTAWRNDDPPYHRYGLTENALMNLPEMDRLFEDKAVYYLERLVRIGRRTGWWVDGYVPAIPSMNSAMGNAYVRPLATVSSNELPRQPKFLTTHTRDLYKRLARIAAENNVAPRQHTRSHNSARLLESFLWNSILFRQTGAEVRSYYVDLITSFPNSLYRTMAMNFTGLIATMMPDETPAAAGDDPRFDRQKLGLALLHDFGVTRDGRSPMITSGPKGVFQNIEQAIRLLDRLDTFGFFEDADIEKLPFWRNDAQVRMGEKPGDESQVRVTVYRRPLDNRKGYKALFVILNESDADIELPLDIRDSQRILGGPNTQLARDILSRTTVPKTLQAAWKGVGDKAADAPALMDLETGESIARVGNRGERYGPVFVPYHDYRVLYGECGR